MDYSQTSVFSGTKLLLGHSVLALPSSLEANKKSKIGGTSMVKFLVALAFTAIVLPAVAIAEVPAKAAEPSTSGAPLEGANSFTEAQARQRISDAGYKDVGPLKKDDQGIWRGEAKKNGAAVSVAVDFKGNIVPAEGKQP
jgi:hypothetical protein